MQQIKADTRKDESLRDLKETAVKEGDQKLQSSCGLKPKILLELQAM